MGGLMESISRRKFFKQAGAAAAVAGAVAVAPLSAANAVTSGNPGQHASEAALAPGEFLGEEENLIAHVRNPQSGEISLFIGEREVLIHDPAIAARLLRATF
jgi:hypothetical protein